MNVLEIQRKQAVRAMKIGAILFVVGFVITVGTFAAASGGGTYIVSWGPMVFGAIRVFRGFAAYSSVSSQMRTAAQTSGPYMQPYSGFTPSPMQPLAAEATAQTGAATADWYPDPSKRHEHRYWDGAAWTNHVSNNGVVSEDTQSA